MSALTKDRDTERRAGDIKEIPVKASTIIFAGSNVCTDSSGWAVPAADTAGFKYQGRAEQYVDNSAGIDGAKNVRVRRGVFEFATSGAAISDLCKMVFATDDQMVAKNGTTNAVYVGRIYQVVSATSVYVDTRERRTGKEQADSIASDVATLKDDFNALLAILRAADLIATG